MAELKLKKKDTVNIPGRSHLKVEQVLIESRENFNELVDALTAMNKVLTDINAKLASQPNLDSLNVNIEAITEIKDTLIPAVEARASANIKKVKAELMVKVDDHGDKIISQEAHSRRRNVIINGKKFVEGENTKEVAKTFLVDNLKLDPAVVSGFLFRDIHRLPAGKIKTNEGVKKGERPIIMAFLCQDDRNAVMRKAFELKKHSVIVKVRPSKSPESVARQDAARTY